MKSIVLSALLVGIVSAQSLAGLPTCAYSCVINSIPASCNYDPKCICSATSFIAGVTCCVTKVCSKADQQATLTYAKGICSPAGITLTQTAAVCSSTANSTMSSTSKSGTGTSTSSGVLASGEITSSVSSSAAGLSSSLSSVISSVSSEASSASSAAATSAAGAAQLLAQNGGNVFAAIVAAAALL